MQYEYESATKQVREELDDPYLKVVYDDREQEYQVLKWLQTGCDRGYYAHQMSFDEWDRRAIEKLRAGRWSRIDVKTFAHNMREQKEKVDRQGKEEVREAGREFGKDIWNHVLHPKIISYQR